jgi:energy-converting hydrogenase Eha subunit F
MRDPFKISFAIGILFAVIVVTGLSIVHLHEPEALPPAAIPAR